MKAHEPGVGRSSADVRTDPLTGATSLVVPRWDVAKAANPAAVPLEMPPGSTPCPFCPEQMADPSTRAGEETARAGGDGGTRAWSAMSLRNRWPNTTDPDAAEVVLLTDAHDRHLLDLPLDDAEVAVALLGERAEAQRWRGLHPLVFVNHGLNAGSSQPHPHGQVLGLQVRDPLAVREVPALAPGRCVLCAPVRDGALVAQLDGVAIAMPVAPTVDYEQVVVLDERETSDPRAVARGIGVALRALWSVTGPVAYNLLFHLDGHVHVHVAPRAARHSGYELAGIGTCYVDPDEATERLARAARAETDATRSDAA